MVLFFYQDDKVEGTGIRRVGKAKKLTKTAPSPKRYIEATNRQGLFFAVIYDKMSVELIF